MKEISRFITAIFAAVFLLVSCDSVVGSYGGAPENPPSKPPVDETTDPSGSETPDGELTSDYDKNKIPAPTEEDNSLETLGAYTKLSDDGTWFTLGTFPQSEIADGVTVDVSKITQGNDGLDYYLGSDHYYYCRQRIEEWGIQKDEKYPLEKWYKVEPIVWQMVNSEKKIYVTAKKLLPLQFYGWHGTGGNQTTIRKNGITDMHYKYSNIRTFLNGINNQYRLDYGDSDSIEQDRNWTGKGFIDNAFTDSQKAQIKKHLIVDSYGDIMTDRIFLLSKDELGSAKIKTEHSGYAKACINPEANDNDKNHWWLRDFAEKEHNICTVRANGDLSDTFSNNEHASVVPAICLNLSTN